MSFRIWASKTSLTLGGLTMLVAGGSNLSRAAAGQDPTPAADNTKANKDGGQTADQQKENKNDREITRQIRKALALIFRLAIAIERGLEMSLDEGLILEANHFGLLAATEDMREGMRAFMEKRPPAFKGK